MENQNRDAEIGTPEVVVPILQETDAQGQGAAPAWQSEALAPAPSPFAATARELVLALLMFVAAYIYTDSRRVWFGVFSVLFIGMVEWRCWERKRSAESWVWLVCLVCLVAGDVLGRGEVWEDYFWLLSHGFAIYWTLCRAGMLAGGESSTLLPMDALNGLFVFPFRSFFLRVRVLWHGVSRPRKNGEKRPASAIGLTTLAVGAAVVLLYLALRYLASANLDFAALTSDVLAWLTPDWNDVDFVNILFRVIFSLPVGAYLFGLICGTSRASREALDDRASRTCARITGLRQVSPLLWQVVMGLFAAVYLTFFIVQFPEMTGGFTRTLPEGLVVAEYAREGFFSLCQVMAVNFTLLWLVTRTGAKDGKATKALATVLLVQGMLFAVIAASKLYLYIDSFGFTPKRLQSAWMILSLFTGGGASLYSLWTRKKSFKWWLLFAGCTMAALNLV